MLNMSFILEKELILKGIRRMQPPGIIINKSGWNFKDILDENKCENFMLMITAQTSVCAIFRK